MRTSGLYTWTAFGLGLGLVLGTAQPAPAQSASDDGWWGWAWVDEALGDRDRADGSNETSESRILDRVDSRVDARGRLRAEARGGAGPAFCRSGSGHPVHGRAWCVEKGFGLGGAAWREADWRDVVFRKHDAGRLDGRLGRRDVEAILGAEVLGRILRHGEPIDAGSFLNGRWKNVDRAGARVLQLRSADRPLAELSDVDGDGRVDAILLHEVQ